MVSANYVYAKAWRDRHPGYNTSYMAKRRRMYSEMYLKGQIAYDDIPKSYRKFGPFTTLQKL